ncbi:MAG: hypothetical protein IPK87_05010 [Planctomycetes bacterium]|nr:hypothetical protein [Planctomycetota bacterium]
MRVFIATILAALLLVSGCGVTLRGSGGGHHYGHSRHNSHRHHSHRSHRHWNQAGPAYNEASRITDITILSVTVPEEIEGEYGHYDEQRWREEWPKQGASLVADGLTKRTEAVVKGSANLERPTTGYYMTIEITYLDVGDPRPNKDGEPKLRGSALSAHGVILNAHSGVVVADVKFTESCGWTGDVPFERFMSQVGSSLGDWFLSKRSDLPK